MANGSPGVSPGCRQTLSGSTCNSVPNVCGTGNIIKPTFISAVKKPDMARAGVCARRKAAFIIKQPSPDNF